MVISDIYSKYNTMKKLLNLIQRLFISGKKQETAIENNTVIETPKKTKRPYKRRTSTTSIKKMKKK
jgi:hypothetical protein